jgi:heme-degrading monooxygenase HmoA
VLVALSSICEAAARMHARMFAFEGSSEEIQAAVALAREELLPLERQMPGFRGLILLSDEEGQKLVSLSLWESEELMLQSEASARTITRLAAQSVGGKRRSIERFDVALLELGT